jgi:2-polyprenyl-3-methyl-5-hydroxy-6-metoxy-1,4-benzoquinol methylase
MDGKCVLCGEVSSSPWGSENGYESVRCSGCGLVYLDPWPDMTEREKALEYGEHPGDNLLRTNDNYRRGAAREYANVLRAVYGSDYFDNRVVEWLDIGCGYGEFLETLNQHVSNDSALRGSEPNLTKQQSAQGRGLDVKFYDLEEMTETYSHISLLNVFSHLPDPIAFLKVAVERLRDGGEILLQTGNGGDVNRDEFPGMLFYPDHLIFGGRKSLEYLFEQIGMEIIGFQEFRAPRFTPMNVAKDIVKRLIRKDHNPVRWRGPYRDLWVRARKNS